MRTSLQAVALAFGCACGVYAQDHGHLNVGASNGVLTWDNAAEFGRGYVKTLIFTNSGKFANVYNGNITLTAPHSTNAFGEVDVAAPKLGSFIVAELVSVQGPEGGAFSFWDSNTTNAPSITLPSGTTNGTFRFELSEAALGAGTPNGDAFGHIHGRRFSATKPGVYRVGFRAYDISTNGPNGGSLQTPSGMMELTFQAGVTISRLETGASPSRLTFGAQSGYSWQVQAAQTLTNPAWTDVDVPILGNDLFQEVQDPTPTVRERYYRVVGSPVTPQ